ncbi:hypothetical protein BZA05DRAFT_402593 [Tricharina praecox]|uniref:uncharacterized protein n=1 Tax=Tricharina praecox TaxID=43433 RepID=UPI00221FBC30|nr:uncharacterized protein BZA05DRAFT_402593 [Tricharina praecox]KAI5849215.1 hypothetical protein BZA05DRAFT_402593 [Tricharina praecox]
MLRATTTRISQYTTAQRHNIRPSSSSPTRSVLLPFLYPSSCHTPAWLRHASTSKPAAAPAGTAAPAATQPNPASRDRAYSTHSSIPIPDGIPSIEGVYMRTGTGTGSGPMSPPGFIPGRSTDAPSLVIVDTPQLPITARRKPRIIQGVSEDKHEALATFEACVKVGRIARAQLILNMITNVLDRDSPLMVGAQNTFLRALLQRALAENNQDSLRVFFAWYEDTMKRDLEILGDSSTYALLLEGSLAVKERTLSQRYIRQYVNHWKERGMAIKDVFAQPILTDEQVIAVAQSCGLDPEELSDKHKELFVKDEPLTGPSIAEIPEVHSSNVKGSSLQAIKQSLVSLTDPDAMPNRRPFGEDEMAFFIARQKVLEEHAIQSAQERWRKDHEELVARGAAPLRGDVGALLWTWHQSMVPLIKQELQRVSEAEEDPTYQSASDRCLYGPFLRLMAPEKVAAVVVLEMMRMQNSQLSGEGTKSAFAVMAIGGMLEQEYYAQELANKKNRDIFGVLEKDGLKELFNDRIAFRQRVQRARQKMQEQPKDTSSVMLEWPPAVRAKLGAVLISMLLHCAKIPVTKKNQQGAKVTQYQPAYQHAYEYVRGRRLGVIKLHPDLVAKLGAEPLQGSALGRNLPMLVPPLPWLAWNDGGYYYSRSRVVRTKQSKEQDIYVQAASNRGDLDQLFEGLDVLGRTAWQVNKRVFDVILEVWNSGKALADIPPKELTSEIPPEPQPSNDPKVRVEWVKLVREAKNAEKNNHSQRCTINLKLEIARSFLFEKFYFPHSVDFRGRAYPIPPNLNHIGDDLSRGILMFAEGKELGERGLRWLKIHCANLAGYDKASFAEREKFIDEHLEDVFDSADNPTKGNRWWLNAEDPWQCLATCISITEALRSPDPTKYKCQTVVAQDGTCNGLQHYAALGGDREGAKQVNLEPSDRPQDVYTGVAELVKAQVAKDMALGDPIATLLHGHITRKVVKQSVMTNVYGVTFVGAREQIRKQLDNVDAIPRDDKHQCASYVTRLVFDGIKEVFTGATKIQHWLALTARMISRSVSPSQYNHLEDHENGLLQDSTNSHIRRKGKVEFMTSVVWTTPLKMPVVQPYRHETSVVVQTNLQKIYISDPAAIDQVNSRKQMTAFPPNFIHSLDATHMLMSAMECATNGITFAAVHDSFWTHPSDVDGLNRILRDAFIDLHSVDIMQKLKQEFETRYKGYKYLVSIPAHTETAALIKAARKKYATQVLGSSGLTVVEDLQWELKRDQLLASNDPDEVEEGRNMITPSELLNRAGGAAKVEIKESLGAELGAVDSTPTDVGIDAKEEDKITGDVFGDDESDPTPYDPETDPEEVVADSEAGHMELDTEEAEHELAEEQEDEEPQEKPKKKKSKPVIPMVHVWMPLEFPDLPAKGEFDVTVLKDSQYFFS